MKKRILSIVLSIVMLVSLLPTTALAAGGGVSVGGVNMYVDNATVTYYKNGGTTVSTDPVDNWNAKYDPTTSTLTIKNLLVAGADSNGIESYVPLNLVLEGANSVTGADDANVSYGIYASDDLTISGDGALSVTGGTGDSSYGIYADNALTITGGTISATAGTAKTNTRGIYAETLTITGGTVVATGGEATGGYGSSCGLKDSGGINISGGVVVARAAEGGWAVDGTLTYNGTKVAGGAINSAAVVIVPDTWTQTTLPAAVDGTITLTGDTYIVNSNEAALELSSGTTIDTNGHTLLSVSLYDDSGIGAPSYGIYVGVSAPLAITGAGSVIAVSGAGKSNYGICAATTASGAATVAAIGTAATRYSRGIYGAVTAGDSARVTAIGGLSTAESSDGIYYGFVTVEDDAEVTAVAGKSGYESFGINGNVTVSGGTLNAIGGVAGSLSCGIHASNKTVTIAPDTTVNAVGRDYGLRLSENGTGNLAAGSYAGGTAAIYINSDVADLLAPGYSYYIDGVAQQPDGSTVGGAYQTVTVGKAPLCTVKFEAGEGNTLVGAESKEVQPSEAYGELPTATPTVEGAAFGGWWTKDGTDGEWGVQVTEDTIVTAVSEHTLYARYGHVHPVCGNTCSHNGAHDPVLWEEWSTSNAMPSEAGNYVLTTEVTLTEAWTTPDGVVLDLNGHNFTVTDGVEVNTGSFTLTDCKGGGTVNCDSIGSPAVRIGKNSTFNQYGGTVKNESADGYGVVGAWNGDVYNYHGGTVTAGEYGIFYVNTVNLCATPDISGGTADFVTVSKIVLHTAITEPSEPYTVSVPKGTSFTKGWTERMGEADYAKYFTGDAGLFTTKIDGELQFAVLEILEQPTKDNGYTVTANDPNATYQWYEWVTKDFNVGKYNGTAGENELAATEIFSVSYDSITGKWTLGSNIDNFASIGAPFMKGDIVTVQFDAAYTGTVRGDYFGLETNADGTVWTGSAIGSSITFSGFTGGETFTVTVTRGAIGEALTGRTGASLLTKGDNAVSITGGMQYACVVNDYLTSEPVEYVHIHDWTFSYASVGNDYGTITATCGNDDCDVNGGDGTAECEVIIDTDVKYSSIANGDNYTCPVSVDRPSDNREWMQAGLGIPNVTGYRLTDGLNGTATITVDGVDACTVPFTLQKGTLTASDFVMSYPDLGYNGNAKEAELEHPANVGDITIKYYMGGVLQDGAPVNVGSYTVELSVAENAYYDAVTMLMDPFTITERDISYVSVSEIPDQFFTGEAITLDESDITITYNGMTLVMGVDFELSGYTNNTNAGQASVTINGIGNYTGTRTELFDIVCNTAEADAAFESHSGWFNFNARPTFRLKDGWSWSTDPAVYGWSVEDFAPTNPADGENQTVNVYVKNADGVYKVTLTYDYDKESPVVTAEEVDNTVWSNVSKDIRVTATDALSGIASVKISDYLGALQDVEFKDGAYYCTVTENGGYTVTVTDNAGNVGYGTVNVTHIDKEAPWFVTSGYNDDGSWHTAAPTVKVEGDDNGKSGIPAEGAYSFDGGATWQNEGTKEYGDGEHYVAIWVKDNVGNITRKAPFTLRVDTVAPGNVTVSATVGGEAYTPGDWTTGDVTFTLSASDATSGVQKYQYSTDNGGTWTDITGDTFTHTAGTDETGVTYVFRAVDNAGNAGAASDSITVKKRQPYTIAFDANGGSGDMADMPAYQGIPLELTENAFTRDGYKFVGWAESADATSVDYVDKQVVSNLNAAPNGVATLYAVWTRDIILSGDIVAPNVSDAENLDVVLVGLDGTEYPVFVTGSQSPYHYTVTVPEGEYQLIIRDTENNITVTAKEELNEDKAEEPITMPTGNKSSIVDSENAGEYAPIVGGLDAIAESTEGTNVTVTLTMTHEPANEDDAEHDALMDAAGSQKGKLTFFEIDLVKNVDGTETSITETTDPIEIVIPFDTTRKQNFKVYRFHDDNGNGDVDEGEVDILTTTANTDGEYIEVGTGSVTIHAKFFSLYAIGYTEPAPYYPPVVSVHVCASKCDVCGGCEDVACTENACKDKCRLFGMNFTDVAEGKWYTDAVEYVYHHKMMEGVGNNLFDINGTTTRAMIVTILWRLEGEPVVNYLMQFEDIPADTWYTEAVRWAASENIVEGYSDTAFGPNDPITREQFATILWRYAKYKGYDVSVGEDTNILSYNDAFDVSEWAIPAMQWACGAGLMEGDGVNLTPKADATRAQAAALFQRFCENVAEK